MNFYLQDSSGSLFSCFFIKCWLLACFDKNIKKIKVFFVSSKLGFLLVVVLEMRKHNLVIWTGNYFWGFVCWLLVGFDLWLVGFLVDFLVVSGFFLLILLFILLIFLPIFCFHLLFLLFLKKILFYPHL